MPDSLLGGQGATLLTAIIIVAVALLALVGVFWLIRNRAASTFIRGGKNRQPRLAVLDATAVDTRRRLVLIRRDDVEHLVMIGGPTDVVIESRIVHPEQAGGARQAEQQQSVAPAAPRPQRAPQPAPAQQPAQAREPAPARAAPPQPARTTVPGTASGGFVEPSVRQAETAPQPAARPQPSVSASPPSRGPAVAAATAVAAGSIRAEAADLLDSARTRVFEEPDFDESDLDDLMDVPPVTARQTPSPSAAAPSRPQTPQTPASAQAPSHGAPGAEAAADPLQAEAADLLENARTRVFENPSFDDSAFDELTAAPAEQERSAAPIPGGGRATGEPATPAKPAATVPSEFEAVLAAELSQDLTHESPRDSLIAAHYTEHQLDPDEADLLEAPEVQPETEPSRDSLEAEMERLLGDLSRKP